MRFETQPGLTEAQRLAVIDSYDLPATGRIDRLDAITDFAAKLCGVPVGLVTLLEATNQRFLGRTGVEMDGTSADISFCIHAIQQPDLMDVPDATADPRFVDNPLVTGELHVRSYAGVPMLSDEGAALGTLCVLGTETRAPLTQFQREGLSVLASAAAAKLREHRTAHSFRGALGESESKFRVLADAMPQMVWSTTDDGYHDYYNARWYEFTGVPQGSTDGAEWNGMFHPEDQDRAWRRWQQSLSSGEDYEIEYRLRRHDGEYRWTLGRAMPLRDSNGAILRWFGTCTDIHDSKTLSEQRELVSHELVHRVKNIFAVISGMVGMSARARPEHEGFAQGLIGKIGALGKAHEYVHADGSAVAGGRHLWTLLHDLFAAYQGSVDRRIVLEGDDPIVRAEAVTPLALLFHELATNAVKYGALLEGMGQVRVAIDAVSDPVRIRWTERGGPAAGAPTGEGFGAKLIEASVTRQLRGTVTRQWPCEGLEMVITIPRGTLVADSAG